MGNLEDHPAFAPDAMPDWVTDPDNKIQAHRRRWAAAQTVTGAYAIVIEDTAPTDGAEALCVAMCPNPEYAQYIAHFHNLVLKGSLALEKSAEEFLQDYASGDGRDVILGALQSAVGRHRDTRPPETGGYL